MSNQTEHDPVCHMDISIASAVGSSTYEGKTYYFCSPGCKKDFDEDPAGVLAAEAAYDHSQAMDHGMMMGSPSAMGAAPAKKPWWRFWG